MPNMTEIQYGPAAIETAAVSGLSGMMAPRSLAKWGVATILVGKSGLARDGLSCMLDAHGYPVADAIETLAVFDPHLEPALVLLTEFGPEQVRAGVIQSVKALAPQARIVVLTSTDDPAVLRHTLQSGVEACLDQQTRPSALIKSLNVVMLGNIVMSMRAVPYLAGSAHAEPRPNGVAFLAEAAPLVSRAPLTLRALSNRELDILRCLADGQSNKLIARRFSIAEATVKIHVKGILRKINVQNRTQAAVWVLKNGIPPIAR